MSKIELTVDLLNNAGFKNSIRQLCQEKVSFGTAFSLRNLVKKIDSAHTASQEAYMGIIKEYAEVDGEGNLVPDKYKEDVKIGEEVKFKAGDDIANSFVIPEDKKEAYVEAMDKFWKEPVELECDKIPLAKLEDIKLSALDIDLIEPVIDIPEDVLNNIIK